MNDYCNPNKGFIKFKKKNKSLKISSLVLVVGSIILTCGILLVKNKFHLFNGKEMENTEYQSNDNTAITSFYEQDKNNNIDITQYESTSKNEYERIIDEMPYWVVFHEGFRAGHLEMSTFKAEDSFRVIWSNNLICNGQIGTCNQYYYDNGEWNQIGTYDILTDNALSIVASNVDICDMNGVKIHEKSNQLFYEINFSPYDKN